MIQLSLETNETRAGKPSVRGLLRARAINCGSSRFGKRRKVSACPRSSYSGGKRNDHTAILCWGGRWQRQEYRGSRPLSCFLAYLLWRKCDQQGSRSVQFQPSISRVFPSRQSRGKPSRRSSYHSKRCHDSILCGKGHNRLDHRTGPRSRASSPDLQLHCWWWYC